MTDDLNGAYLLPMPSYTTTQRYLFLEFKSDYSIELNGFNATYKSTLIGL
jgi:hypothetical protein